VGKKILKKNFGSQLTVIDHVPFSDKSRGFSQSLRVLDGNFAMRYRAFLCFFTFDFHGFHLTSTRKKM